MFKIDPDPVFTAPIDIPLPGGERKSFTGSFKHKGRAEAQAFLESAQGDDVEMVAEILLGWDGVDAEFSRETLARLLDNYVGAGAAILEAWALGLAGGRAKN